MRVPRAVLGIADQGVSSVSNLAATIAIAHLATRSEFGAFGIVLSVYLLTVTISRGCVGGVLGLRASELQRGAKSTQVGQALGAATAVGMAASLAIALAAILAEGALQSMLLVLALATTGLVLQDTVRQVGYATERPGAAVANSVSWGAAQLAISLGLLAGGVSSPTAWAAAWAISASAGTLVGLLLLRTRIRISGAPAWFNIHKSLIGSLSLEYMLVAGVAQGAPLLVGAVAGLGAVGSIRAAMTAFGPMTMVSHGLAMSLVPVAARRYGHGKGDYARPLIVVGIVLAASCWIWALLLWLMPTPWGEALLSSNWAPAHSLLLIFGAWIGLGYLAEPAVAGLRISNRNWAVARIRAVLAPLTLALVAGGAAVQGAVGAVSALTLITGASVLIYWQRFRSAAS